MNEDLDLGALDSTTAGSPNAQLQALSKQLDASLRAEVKQQEATKPVAADTIFGFTMGALFAGFVISTLGLAYIKYAKTTAQPIVALFGVVMLLLPFFVTDAVLLTAIGSGLVLAPFALRRVGLI